MLDFVEASKKEISAHEYENNWTLVKRKKINDEKISMFIW